MIASEPGVPYGKLLHKKLEIAKKKCLRSNYGNFDAIVSLDNICKSDIQWWIDNIEVCKRFVVLESPSVPL